MHVILIPGLWLDAASWDDVVPVLEGAGHRAHALTLPGLAPGGAQRAAITLADHVAAVVAQLDALDAQDGPVLLIGHSAGAGIAYAAVDARPDRVARLICVGGFPTGDGNPIAGDYPAVDGVVPFPEWSAFEESELAGLDADGRRRLQERAIPSPERVLRDPQRLGDERRLDVPVTVVCTDFTSEMLRSWVSRDLPPVRELARIRDVTYVDLATGHWPQFSCPEELARLIVAGTGSAVDIDEHGRPEPPLAAGEVTTLLGFLDYQRATLEWKCRGLDAAALGRTVAASSMTLGGLLKHLAYVEDAWFARSLHGHDRRPPWDTVDWSADPDWDWHSAAADSPEQLFALWREAVVRSRALTADALQVAGAEQLAQRRWPDGRAPSLRWILCHMIEEYARHNGHADLLREAIDGQTGE